jgi:zinc resistance-associated protein
MVFNLFIKFISGGIKMKASNFGKVIVGVAIVAIVGFAATSYAGWGRGGGRAGGYCGGQGSGFGPGVGMGPRGYGAAGNQGSLSDEQIDKLNKERQAFFEETRTVRDSLYQKQLELRSELAKKDPDVQKATGLQGEISNLQSQLAQKRIEQQIKMKKDFPELADRGYRSGGTGYGRRGMGPGYGPQGMMGPGYGPRGKGPGYGRGGAGWN